MGGVGLWLRALLFALGAMALNVAAFFLWVFIYSIVIAPGHAEAFYQAYADRAAPISSIVAGVPIFFLAGWLAARRAPAGRAILAGALVAIVYIAIDLTILLSIANNIPMMIIVTSFVTKLAAASLGGVMAERKSRSPTGQGQDP